MTRGMLPGSHRRSGGLTPAERVRNVLARALSAHVEWLDGQTPLDASEVTGVILGRGGEASGGQSRPVTVEVADVAPLPMADRVRARVRLHGHAGPVAGRPGAIRLHAVRVELEEAGTWTQITPDELRAAEADPVASSEGVFLCHLAHDHAGLVRTLTRLIDRDHLDGARRVVPLTVDRMGLTFRVEYRRGHRDVLLGFREPATSFDGVRAGLRDLAMQAHCHCAPRPAGSVPEPRGGLRDLLAAGPAAARICATEEPDDSTSGEH